MLNPDIHSQVLDLDMEYETPSCVSFQPIHSQIIRRPSSGHFCLLGKSAESLLAPPVEVGGPPGIEFPDINMGVKMKIHYMGNRLFF